MNSQSLKNKDFNGFFSATMNLMEVSGMGQPKLLTLLPPSEKGGGFLMQKKVDYDR